MLAHLEAVSQRAGEHASAGCGADQREWLEGHVDRAGIDAITEDKVSAEVLHRRVKVFFDRRRQSMDLVDEEDLSRLQVGEVGQEVLGCLEPGAGCHVQRNIQLGWNTGREGCLAESGWAVEEDVPKCFATFAGGVHGNPDTLEDVPLADDVIHAFGTQRMVDLVSLDLGTEYFLMSHAKCRRWIALLPVGNAAGNIPEVTGYGLQLQTLNPVTAGFAGRPPAAVPPRP